MKPTLTAEQIAEYLASDRGFFIVTHTNGRRQVYGFAEVCEEMAQDDDTKDLLSMMKDGYSSALTEKYEHIMMKAALSIAESNLEEFQDSTTKWVTYEGKVA